MVPISMHTGLQVHGKVYMGAKREAISSVDVTRAPAYSKAHIS